MPYGAWEYGGASNYFRATRWPLCPLTSMAPNSRVRDHLRGGSQSHMGMASAGRMFPSSALQPFNWLPQASRAKPMLQMRGRPFYEGKGGGPRCLCKPFGGIGCSITLFLTSPVESQPGFPFIPLDMRTRTNLADAGGNDRGHQKRQ